MNRQREAIPIMDYGQYRRARRLVHECCNYDGGNCLALDDGAECVCVQSISYSLLCHWFRAAVLRWIRRWKRPCSTGARPKGAPCAGPYSGPAPTGPSIARIAPHE